MTVATGPVVQLCWVVEDIEAAERFHSEHFGVRGWMRMPDVHFAPDTCEFRGAPADFVVHVSLAYVGDLQLELIQPVSGESIYTEFLERNGPGLHHFAYETDDLGKAVEVAEAAGLEVLQRGVMAGGLMSFAYVDGAAGGAPYVELVELSDDLRAIFASIKAGSVA